MRVTIIREDNTVTVDGVPYVVNCTDLPAAVHAIQWDGAQGDVEYVTTKCAHCGVRSKKQNSQFTDAMPYQKYLDAWYAAKLVDDQKKAEAAALAAKQAADIAEIEKAASNDAG